VRKGDARRRSRSFVLVINKVIPAHGPDFVVPPKVKLHLLLREVLNVCEERCCRCAFPLNPLVLEAVPERETRHGHATVDKASAL
jgi:hypothetical protein